MPGGTAGRGLGCVRWVLSWLCHRGAMSPVDLAGRVAVVSGAGSRPVWALRSRACSVGWGKRRDREYEREGPVPGR